MILSRFRWYRRMRGGYWAQVTSLLFGRRWVKCDRPRPTPDNIWEFHPFAIKTASNTYIDEWHDVYPCWAVPLSKCTEPLAWSLDRLLKTHLPKAGDDDHIDAYNLASNALAHYRNETANQ